MKLCKSCPIRKTCTVLCKQAEKHVNKDFVRRKDKTDRSGNMDRNFVNYGHKRLTKGVDPLNHHRSIDGDYNGA